jgi:hypothetical protein
MQYSLLVSLEFALRLSAAAQRSVSRSVSDGKLHPEAHEHGA